MHSHYYNSLKLIKVILKITVEKKNYRLISILSSCIYSQMLFYHIQWFESSAGSRAIRLNYENCNRQVKLLVYGVRFYVVSLLGFCYDLYCICGTLHAELDSSYSLTICIDKMLDRRRCAANNKSFWVYNVVLENLRLYYLIILQKSTYRTNIS